MEIVAVAVNFPSIIGVVGLAIFTGIEYSGICNLPLFVIVSFFLIIRCNNGTICCVI